MLQKQAPRDIIRFVLWRGLAIVLDVPASAVSLSGPFAPSLRTMAVLLFSRELRAMSYADKTLTCRECGSQFTFTAGGQEFYDPKGFTHAPPRRPDCRAGRKAAG